jgi:hypothetical protein
LGSVSENMHAMLLCVIDDPKRQDLHFAAINALSKMDVSAKTLLPVLLKVIRKGSTREAESAAISELQRCQVSSDDTIAALIDALHAGRGGQEAAFALAHLGSASDKAVAAILEHAEFLIPRVCEDSPVTVLKTGSVRYRRDLYLDPDLWTLPKRILRHNSRNSDGVPLDTVSVSSACTPSKQMQTTTPVAKKAKPEDLPKVLDGIPGAPGKALLSYMWAIYNGCSRDDTKRSIYEFIRDSYDDPRIVEGETKACSQYKSSRDVPKLGTWERNCSRAITAVTREFGGDPPDILKDLGLIRRNPVRGRPTRSAIRLDQR